MLVGLVPARRGEVHQLPWRRISTRANAMSTVTRNQTALITIDQYEQMVEDGNIGEHERVELIEGRVVAKMPKGPQHSTSAGRCQRALARLLPPGWHVRKEEPIRIL